jgi:hypothetical protein
MLSLLCILTSILGVSHSYSFRQPFFKHSPLHIPPTIINTPTTQTNYPIYNINSSERQCKSQSQSPLSTQKKLDDLNQLTTVGLMFCGALSRTVAALAIHPLHAMKVNLQMQQPPLYTHSDASKLLVSSAMSLLTPTTLTHGLGTQLLLTLPHGALSFAVTEITKKWLLNNTSSRASSSSQKLRSLDPLFDLVAASLASVVCSVISIPQMLLTDRIMVGQYPSLSYGLREIIQTQGSVIVTDYRYLSRMYVCW